MDAHAIIRTDDVLEGRWRFDGTTVAIADIRRDYAIGDGPLMEPYRRLGISEQDIQAALTFEFPEIRRSRVEVDQSYITVHCVCGEDTRQTIAWPAMTVRCVCDRLWKVSVVVDRLDDAPVISQPNGNPDGADQLEDAPTGSDPNGKPDGSGPDGDLGYQFPREASNGDL